MREAMNRNDQLTFQVHCLLDLEWDFNFFAESYFIAIGGRLNDDGCLLIDGDGEWKLVRQPRPGELGIPVADGPRDRSGPGRPPYVADGPDDSYETLPVVGLRGSMENQRSCILP